MCVPWISVWLTYNHQTSGTLLCGWITATVYRDSHISQMRNNEELTRYENHFYSLKTHHNRYMEWTASEETFSFLIVGDHTQNEKSHR